MRILKGTQFLLTSPTFVGADRETPTDCGSTPTCTVTREDGTALTAATVTSLGTGTGQYSALITTTHTSQLDELQIVWTGTTASTYVQVYRQTIEVVGAHYCTNTEIRAKRGVDSTSKFSTLDIEEVRDQYEDVIEAYLGVPLVRRYARDQVDGTGTNCLRLLHLYPRTLISVTVDGTSKTTTEFNLREEGDLVWTSSYFMLPTTSSGVRNVKVAYEHGFDNPTAAIKREVLKAIRLELLADASNDSGNSVISETFDGRTLRYSTPDPTKGRPTGVLSLDPILVNFKRDLRRRWPGVA